MTRRVQVTFTPEQAERLDSLERRFGLPAPELIRLLVRDAGHKLEVRPREGEEWSKYTEGS